MPEKLTDQDSSVEYPLQCECDEDQNPDIPVELLRRIIDAAERGMETDSEFRAVEGAKMYLEIYDSFQK